LIVVLLADGATIGLRLCHSLVLIVILLIRIRSSLSRSIGIAHFNFLFFVQQNLIFIY